MVTHARRKFVEAEKTAQKIAGEAVDLIGQLFAVEKQAKDGSVAERSALRQTQSAPVLAELRQKLLAWKEQLLPKHPMAEAVNYTLSQWEELTVLTSDGAVPIDNNVRDEARGSEPKELAIRGEPSRRVDSSDSGQLDQQLPPARDGSATLLHATADESMNLPSWPANDLDAWLPDRWKQAHAARCEALEISPLDS
jgi:transposase